MGRLLRRGEFPTPRCCLGLEDREARQDKAREALLLIQATAGWQGIASQLGQALLRGVPVIGVAPEAHVTGLVEHEEVVAPVAVLRPTVILWRLLRVLRTLDGACGPLMQPREAGAEASVGGVISRAATSAAVRAGRHAGSAQA
jgi:hypothetical protein